MPKMSRKWRRQAPIGETLALSGHNHHPVSQTLAPLGLLQPAHVCQKAQHTAICSRRRPTSPGWRPIHLGQRPICKGLIPMVKSLPKRPDEGVLLLLHARARHNSVLPLPSQQPSDGLFSPMEVRANHLPMCTDPLVPVRRAWSCTSKTTPSMGSSVLDIIAM
jgi:hypothetical protein